MDQQKVEETILELAKSKPEGISTEHMKEQLPDTSLNILATAINKCLKTGLLELFKDKDKLLYKYKDPVNKATIKGDDKEEKVVFRIIQEAGNKGIWIQDIRNKSNLSVQECKKVLKKLENKKLIKEIKPVTASKKKFYMLYELEPDNSITGGAWYQDQDFESEFVDILNQQCHRYLQQRHEEANKTGGGPLLIRNRSYATVEEVHKFISDLKVSKVNLSMQDIESILYTVVLDNNAERTLNPQGQYIYRAVNRCLPSTGFVKTTCCICPMFSKCSDVGWVTPITCVYLKNWLNEY